METNSYQFNPADYAAYRFRATHDNGKMTMSVLARDEAHGRARIRNLEDCPDSAIETLLFSPMRNYKLRKKVRLQMEHLLNYPLFKILFNS